MDIKGIVGIGASAGGLEPLETFFSHVPQGSGLAFIVIQHLAPHHKSMMNELLSRYTTLKISVITDGMSIAPDHIYLNPPQKFVYITKQQTFRLIDKQDKALSFPINSFFISLADQFSAKATAVILSGTGSDGSEGIKRIKENGGLVVVQSPEDAKFDGMPKNAVFTGTADLILPVLEIPQRIIDYYQGLPILSEEGDEQSIESEHIHKILGVLYTTSGIDFIGYKVSTIYRRIQRRMSILGIKRWKDYITLLKESFDEAQILTKDLLIGVTKFFRDADAFEAIRDQVLPEILAGKNKPDDALRVWIPACSTGEEAYSIAMLIKDFLIEHKLSLQVSIFATDLDREAIKTAGNRVFPDSIIHEVPEHILKRFFVPVAGGFKVTKEIREMIVFSVHNILSDPPFSRIDLVSCRNFLIYLKPELQQRVFSYFRYTLVDGGFLFLGASESLGASQDYFTEVDKKWKIYRNKKSLPLAETPSLKYPKITPISTDSSGGGLKKYKEANQRQLIEQINKQLIQKFVPLSVICDDTGKIIHTTGNVFEFLKIAPGEVSLNLIGMLPKELSLTFDVAMTKVWATGLSLNIDHVHIHHHRSYHFSVRLSLIELDEVGKMIIVLFEERLDDDSKETNTVTQSIDLSKDAQEKLHALEREIRVTKENLQTTIEELESSNEELQAANEELQSSNEELESVNEELYTVNSEFQEKVQELSVVNDDLNNLINSTDISMLFLDEDLMIRKYTRSMQGILSIKKQDIGRHISDLKEHLKIDNFLGKIEEVLRTLISSEEVVEDFSDKKYLLKINPFRTGKNEIKGVVLSLLDISQLELTKDKLSQSESNLFAAKQRIAEQEDLFKMIALHSSDFIGVHDVDGRFEYVSPSCKELTGYTPEELIGRDPYDFFYPKDRERIREMSHQPVAKQKQNTAIEYRYVTKSGDLKWFETTSSAITNESGEIVKILTATRDITKGKTYERELALLSLIATETANAIIITDIKGQITWVNQGFVKSTGYTLNEVKGKKPGQILQGEETELDKVQEMSEAIKAVRPFDVELFNYKKNGEKFLSKIVCQPYNGEDGTPDGFFAIQTDITLERQYQFEIEKVNTQLEQQNQKLAMINNELKDFAHITSHDLKEPVRSITSLLDIILEDHHEKLDQEAMEMLKLAIQSGKGMIKMINNLLEYSKTGQSDEPLTEVNLQLVAQESVKRLKSQISSNHVTVHVENLTHDVKGYEGLLVRLFQNLISNAIKYKKTNVSPELYLKSEIEDQYVKVTVTDNGIGIAQKNIPKIFKLFTRVGRYEHVDGSGIGLSICKKIMDRHAGEISVSSALDKGTTFTLKFPQAI
ncbi:CheR family methyltransferase [Penaeicola halotolerans]|uniref:CheR family methyltransferase n=1 Tax=Penaeicola halotolerans TaxID=2793196 RepID=UPI001CF8F068|nr:CheR family methyltransferase [Penaeicola halotolerans]